MYQIVALKLILRLKRGNNPANMSKPHVYITFIDDAMTNLIKTQENTDEEYLEEMKTFQQIDLTPNTQGYTPEKHPT